MWFVKVIRSGARDANGNLPPEVWSEGEIVPTLNQFDNTGESRATVIIFEATRVDDVRIYENKSPTVATYWGTGGSRVPYVFPIQGSQIGREDKNGPQGSGFGEEDGPMFTVNTTDKHAVAVSPTLTAYNMDSRSPQSEESQRIVQSVHETTSVVRRLTPTECERLQGFPDGWTEGQADSHRYKQMGNAVAVPVVGWIMERLVACDEMV